MTAQADWIKQFTKEQVKAGLQPLRNPLELACCHTSNYFNFGSMVRTAHNFLCRKIYAVEMNGQYYKKATMGAKKYEDIDKCTLREFLDKTQSRNIVVFESRPGLVSTPLYDFEWPDQPIMFFGGEKFGIPNEVLDVVDETVSIPVQGVLNDFNVSVAAGIAAYDWVSKHRNDS